MKKNILSIVFIASCYCHYAYGGPTNQDPDTDADGVSDFEDNCPKTPLGKKVWTQADVEANKALPVFVGCAGGLDTAVAGYSPPSRPALGSLFYRILNAYQNGKIPDDADLNFAVHVGRAVAWNLDGALLTLPVIAKTLPDRTNGPLDENRFLISYKTFLNRSADEFDFKSFQEVSDELHDVQRVVLTKILNQDVLQAHYNPTNPSDKGRYGKLSLRKFNQYLVYQNTNEEKNIVTSMGYFFIKKINGVFSEF